MSPTDTDRQKLNGVVVQARMDKTVVVLVTRKYPHPVYRKYVTRTKKYYAHDEQNACGPGAEVIIEGTRPLSRSKRWRVHLRAVFVKDCRALGHGDRPAALRGLPFVHCGVQG